jgi:hypothetical protein
MVDVTRILSFLGHLRLPEPFPSCGLLGDGVPYSPYRTLLPSNTWRLWWMLYNYIVASSCLNLNLSCNLRPRQASASCLLQMLCKSRRVYCRVPKVDPGTRHVWHLPAPVCGVWRCYISARECRLALGVFLFITTLAVMNDYREKSPFSHLYFSFFLPGLSASSRLRFPDT